MDNDTPWWETALNKVGTTIGQGIDYVVNDGLQDWVGGWSGMNDNQPIEGLGGNPYTETTPPTSPNPTVQPQGFTIGNNAGTWAMGAGVLLLGFIAYKVVK